MYGCKSEYAKIVEEEKNSGKIYEELPFGLRMGMTKKEYFAECWKLNKDGIIGAGPGNEYAKYELKPIGAPDSLHDVKMLFYGIFDQNDIMYGMDIIMEFHSWSPWNEMFHSPALIKLLEHHYKETYKENPFMSVDVNEELEARVKVDGNRRITMYPLSKQKVAVKMIDLRHQIGSQ